MGKMVYSGIYRDGAKIKTERDDDEITLYIRRNFDSREVSYVMTIEQATEMSYALIRAIKQINEEKQDVQLEVSES